MIPSVLNFEVNCTTTGKERAMDSLSIQWGCGMGCGDVVVLLGGLGFLFAKRLGFHSPITHFYSQIRSVSTALSTAQLCQQTR